MAHGELGAYAATRWPAVVRTLVLLGAPAAEARRLAVEAIGRLLDAAASGDVGDHEVALFREVVAAWEDDRARWWTDGVVDPAPVAPDLEDVLGRLDLLDPATRARRVLEAVAGLGPGQLDDVVEGGDGVADAVPAVALTHACASIDPGPAGVHRAARTAHDRHRRRRAATAVGVGAAITVAAVAAVAAVALIDPTDPPDPSGPGSTTAAASSPRVPTREPEVLVRRDGDLPVPWYDGASVWFGPDSVTVPGLQDLAVTAGGVAGVSGDGTVYVVTPEGPAAIGRASRGTTVTASASSPDIVWTAPDGTLAFAADGSVRVRREVPPGARLVLFDGTAAYLSLRERGAHLVVRAAGRQELRPGPVPVDVAGGTRVERTVVPGLRVVRGGRTLDLPGLSTTGALLSDDGRHLAAAEATSSSNAPAVIVDLRSGERVDLPVPDDGRVVDVAFGPTGVVTLVLSRPDGARFPKTVPRGDLAQPDYDIVTCRLRAGTCESAVQLDAFTVSPLIAH